LLALVRRTRLVAVLVLLSALQVFAQQPAPQPKRIFHMWRVTSPTATVYLVGSMHLIRKDAYPLPAVVEDAFSKSDVLVVELNLNAIDKTTMGALVQKYGVYDNVNDVLSNHISKSTSAALDDFCKQYDLPRANVEHLKPWLISTLVAVLPLQKAGADPNAGIDMHFMKQSKAPQRIDELETPELQLSLLAAGSDQEQDVSLGYSLRHLDETKKIEADYLAGDFDALMKRIQDSPSKGMMERLLDGRNPKMIEKLETYLKGKETAFVVVGAAHVIGEKGIARALESKNYKVEKLAIDW
jgi:uncharacterized protein YbaP (TraB family)